MYTNSKPVYRARAAARLLKLFQVLGELEKAAELATNVIGLLLVVNRRFLDLEDRQFAMSNFSSIAANVCALLLQTKGPDQALHYLEKGRLTPLLVKNSGFGSWQISSRSISSSIIISQAFLCSTFSVGFLTFNCCQA